MAQYFVKTDSDGYITKALAALTEQDNVADYQLIMIASQYDNQFATNFTKWRISELGVPLAPGNLPKATVDEFNQTLQGYKEQLEAANQTISDQTKKINEQQETITDQGTSIDTLTTDNTTLKKMAAGLTMQVAQLQAAVTPKEGE